MADVTVKKFDDLESYQGPAGRPSGGFLYAGKGLGVTAWGMNVLRLPPSWPDYPDHDHKSDGQEEVYVVLEGSATLDELRRDVPIILADEDETEQLRRFSALGDIDIF